MKIHLRSMDHNKAVRSSITNGLEISEFSGKQFYVLPDVFTQREMPVSTDNIISVEKLTKRPYHNGIQIPRIRADVDLLIGLQVDGTMGVINSPYGPYAVKALLGWVINSRLQGNNDKVKVIILQ